MPEDEVKPEKVKVWISKYALTQGIYEAAVEISQRLPHIAVQKQLHSYPSTYHGEGKEWHRTEAGAREAANKMLKTKVASLKKSLAKFEKMKF